MNDKQQLAAIGAEMAEQQQQPMCMAKRIEELEAQVRVMAGLLREARPYMDHRGGAGVKGYTKLTRDIDVALASKMPSHTEQPLAMVPGGDGSRSLFERWFRRDYHPDRQGPHVKDITWAAWQAALAATQSPDGTK